MKQVIGIFFALALVACSSPMKNGHATNPQMESVPSDTATVTSSVATATATATATSPRPETVSNTAIGTETETVVTTQIKTVTATTICTPEIMFKSLPASDVTVIPPTLGVIMTRFSLIANCVDQKVSLLSLGVSALGVSNLDPRPFHVGDGSNPESWNFRNLRIVDADGKVVAGPLNTPKNVTSNQQAELSFIDQISLKVGESPVFTLLADVPASFSSGTEETRFKTSFNGLNSLSKDFFLTVMSNDGPTVTVLQSKSGCEVVGSANFSYAANGASKKVTPLTSAASDEGTAVAFYDGDTNGVTVNLYDLNGKLISVTGLSTANNTYPWSIKMVGGKNDYVVAITEVDGTKENGWLSDYSFYRVAQGYSKYVAGVKGIRSLALASDGEGEFYSFELVGGQGVSTVYCNTGTKTIETSSVRMRPLLSGLQPVWTFNGNFHQIVDASVIGSDLKILLAGSVLDCEKSYSIAQIVSEKVVKKDGAFTFGPTTVQPYSVLKEWPETVFPQSLLVSSNVTGMFWMNETSTGNGGYNRSFHISMVNGDSNAPSLVTVPAQPTYLTDKSAVMGWDDNIVQVVEGWDTNPGQVLLYVGKGDMKWMAHKLYNHEKGQYVKSFAGKDKHFVILDGRDMVSGTYGAWATFVTCK